MTLERSYVLQEMGTRLEWVYPLEFESSMLPLISPLFSWAAGSDGPEPQAAPQRALCRAEPVSIERPHAR
jgi:hypothetical protein